jgi:hypothetical protein
MAWRQGSASFNFMFSHIIVLHNVCNLVWGISQRCVTRTADFYFYFYRWVAAIKLLIILPLSGVRIKINYTKSSPECCTFNEVQIKTRLLILRSEQSLESGKTRDGHCSGWKSIPIRYSPWIDFLSHHRRTFTRQFLY